ncbi:MAG: hypothetical protein JWN38_976 [Candidatus Saccharibacteria bacterium]|nr:hypothetical protein [Candidatus Saccharibacteria bacterium]
MTTPDYLQFEQPAADSVEVAPLSRASGSFILDTSSNEYLFIRRDNLPGLPSPNMIGLVGGFIEADESVEAACRREIGEELVVAATGKPFEVDELKPFAQFANSAGTRLYIHMTEVASTEGLELGSEGSEIVRLSREAMLRAAAAHEFAGSYNELILARF